MITEMLEAIEKYTSAKSKGECTVGFRKQFAERLMDFIDFRVKAEIKQQKELFVNTAFELLSKAPDPQSENFAEEYKKWYKEKKKLL